MEIFLFGVCSALICLLVLIGLSKRGGYLELPFLIALTVGGWFMPQAFALLNDRSLPHGAIERVVAMATLSLICLSVGWAWGLRPRKHDAARAEKSLEAHPERWAAPLIFLTMANLGVHALLELQPAAARAATQPSGPITILYFLARIGLVPLALSFVLWLRWKRKQFLAFFLVNLSAYALALLVYFRRQETFEVAMVLLGALWFVRRTTVPRVLLLAAATVAFFFVQGVGHLRDIGGGYRLSDAGTIERRIPSWQEIAEIDWGGIVREGAALPQTEARNGAILMEAVPRTGYGFGAEFWNEMIIAYVPGQIIGVDAKQALLIGQDIHERTWAEAGYAPISGMTDTGFFQPYQDFSFVGAAVFGLFAYLLGSMFRRAMNGDTAAQATYLATVVAALMTITHSGYYWFVNSPLSLLAIAGATWFAHSGVRTARIRPPLRPRQRSLQRLRET